MRYPRLYLNFLRFSFSRAMEFRVDFFFRIVMDIIYYAVNLAFFAIVYRHTTLLGGWNLDQVYVFVSGFLLVDAIYMTVFSSNLWWLPIFINRGDLDYYLVRPVSSLFFLSLREFAANSFMNLLIATGIVVWALARYPEPLGAGRIALFVLLLVVGTILHYLVYLLFLIPVFWIHTERGLGELSFHLSKFLERPHQIFGGWLRVVLLTVLPFALMASMPAHVLFGDDAGRMLLHTTAVVAGMAVCAVIFWRIGLRAYSSASS